MLERTDKEHISQAVQQFPPIGFWISEYLSYLWDVKGSAIIECFGL